MKINISKSQWEEMGNKAGWKIAQAQQPAQQPAQQAKPVNTKGMQIIEQNLKSLEQQANALPLNGQKIRVLIGQIRQLAQTDPSNQG
jgi:hypothetical protein